MFGLKSFKKWGFSQLVKNLSTNKGKDQVYEQLNDFKDHDNRTAQVET